MKLFGFDITRRTPERKESPTWASILSFLGGQNAIYTPADYNTLAKAGYQACAPVFSVISLITRTASRIDWVVQRQRGGDYVEVESHPLGDLLAQPNEYMSGPQFVEAVMSYKLLDGNSYIHKVHGVQSRPPKFLYAYRPDRMRIKPGTAAELVGGYVYTVNQQPTPLAAADVLHLRDFHPLDDFYGLSRLEVSGTLIDTMNWLAEWNLKLLQNDMRPPGMMTVNGQMTDAQFSKFEDQVRKKYSGADNAGKPLLIHAAADIDWKQLSISPRDMDWIEMEKTVLRRICAVYNVPSELLGDSENKTYSNVQEARKALYQETVLPEMDLLRDSLNSWLAPLYGGDVVLDYDRDSIEALQEDRERKYSYLTSANFLTVNEKREAAGYDDIGPDGDVVLVGMGEMALNDAVAPAGDLGGGGDDDDGKSLGVRSQKSLGVFWRGDTERKALWRNFERRVASKERAFMREMRSWLEKQGRSIVAKAEAGAKTAEAMLDRDAAEKSYRTTFSSRYLRLFASALAAGRTMTEGKLYEFDGEDKADGISDALRKKLEKLIEEAAEVITDETVAEIQAVLREATGTNLTVQEIANALKDKLVDQMPDVRARRIARTETGMLENAGNLEGFKENEFVNRKIWICSFVENSRDTHMEADGQEVGIDDPFKVGSDLMDYPMDRSHGAGAGEVVNCLCAIAPLVE